MSKEKEKELREIEARIAVELMGWMHGMFSGGIHKTFHRPSTKNVFGFEILLNPPRYARDISAAMEAAEAMESRGYWWDWRSKTLCAGKYFVEFGTEALDAWDEARESLPEAIARCIVAALDAEEKQ